MKLSGRLLSCLKKRSFMHSTRKCHWNPTIFNLAPVAKLPLLLSLLLLSLLWWSLLWWSWWSLRWSLLSLSLSPMSSLLFLLLCLSPSWLCWAMCNRSTPALGRRFQEWIRSNTGHCRRHWGNTSQAIRQWSKSGHPGEDRQYSPSGFWFSVDLNIAHWCWLCSWQLRKLLALQYPGTRNLVKSSLKMDLHECHNNHSHY